MGGYISVNSCVSPRWRRQLSLSCDAVERLQVTFRVDALGLGGRANRRAMFGNPSCSARAANAGILVCLTLARERFLQIIVAISPSANEHVPCGRAICSRTGLSSDPAT